MRSLFTLTIVLLAAAPALAQDMPLSQVLIEGEGWKPVGKNVLPSKPTVVGLTARDVVLTRKGDTYCTVPAEHALYLLQPGQKPRKVADKVMPAGITLWPDQGTLVVGDNYSNYLWAYRIEKDGGLANKERYYTLRTLPGKTSCGTTALTMDQAGRCYAATELGVQIFDPTGRMSGVLLKPESGPITGIAFGGADGSQLLISFDTAVYARKTQAKGVGFAAVDPVKHRIMLSEYGKGGNRLIEVSADGKLVWEHKFPSISVIFDVLPNGNIIYAYGGSPTGVQEVTRDHKVVWNYKSSCPQVLGCERLANGNTLVAEQGPCQVVEVDPQGTVVKTIPLTTTEKHFHRQVRNIHRLANGNILATHEGEGAVREVDPSGRVVWEYPGVADVFEAQRLPNGNTLISCGTQKRIIEVTPQGKIAWELTAKDVPELNLTWTSSMQRLKNGNLVIGNFLRGQEGKGAHAFEITRDKKVVWTYADHALIKSLTTIRVLDD